jgi:hypothetical protein
VYHQCHQRRLLRGGWSVLRRLDLYLLRRLRLRLAGYLYRR